MIESQYISSLSVGKYGEKGIRGCSLYIHFYFFYCKKIFSAKNLESSDFCSGGYFIPSFWINPIHFKVWTQSSHQKGTLGAEGRSSISTQHPRRSQVWCQVVPVTTILFCIQLQQVVPALFTTHPSILVTAWLL